MITERQPVRKTYKLFIGGAFARSESGRTFVRQRHGREIHVARASRKDVRDAVRAARTAWPAWRDRTAYNRGQIIYRLAEIMESRRGAFVETLADSGAAGRLGPDAELSAAIDRVVWYAGWCDKIEQQLSTKNPVGLNYFNVSSPEPTGVVGVVAPDNLSLLGLISTLMPALAGANTVVLVASQADPLTPIVLAEAIATSDVPSGTVNILTGYHNEVVPALASHRDVNALDLWGDDHQLNLAAAQSACDNVKRVRRGGSRSKRFWFSDGAQGLDWIEAFVEIKTVWHPAGV